jgi:hypothetical protein
LPPHSSHVLQPLDLAIYGPFKLALRDEAYAYELETGQPVDKDAALLVIGRAYEKAFTPSNILEAFRRAGIWPLDGNAIDMSVTAPSESTSVVADAPLPVPTVLKRVVRAFDNITPIRAPNLTASAQVSPAVVPQIGGGLGLHCDDPPEDGLRSPLSPSALAQKYAVATRDSLIGTSYEHIVSASPAKSSDPQLPMVIRPELPIRKPDFTLLQTEPDYTELTQPLLVKVIAKLRFELDLSRLHIKEMESTIRTYQASLVLSGAHSRKQQKQLHGHEEKARKKGNAPIKADASKGRIISCEEAEQYELDKLEAEAQKERDKETRMQQRQAKRDAREAEQAAKKASREADKAVKEAYCSIQHETSGMGGEEVEGDERVWAQAGKAGDA